MADSDNPYVTEYPNLANIDSVNSDKVDGCDVSTNNEMFPVSDNLIPTQKAVYDFVTGRESGGVVLGNMVYSGLDTATAISLSYSAATRTLTVTYSEGFNVWIQGTAYPKSSTQAVSHADVTDVYYYYFNSTGVLVVGTTEPDFEDNVRVCEIDYTAGGTGTKTDTLDSILFCSGQIRDEVERLDDLIDVLEAGKADDDAVVHDTGNETVAGIKTFSSFPITPSSAPTTDYQVANKKYIDDLTATVRAVDTASIGTVEMWSSPTLKTATGATYMWADGSSLLRASYTALWAKYYVSKGTCTITQANPGVVTLNTHGFSTGACVSLTVTGAFAVNLAADTQYFVIYNDANTFWLATSLDNALAGTKINTTGTTASGEYTLYSNPWGFADATHFNLPDFEGFVPVGAGAATIGGLTKDNLSIGAAVPDQGQGHFHIERVGADLLNGDSGALSTHFRSGRDYVGSYMLRTADTQNLTHTIRSPITDGTNGAPRTGAHTRETKKAINYIVRVL